MGSEARQGLQHHPTVKPVAMLEDALLDMTERGDIVLDPFLGSGSTLIAAEKTGRRCRGLERPQLTESRLRARGTPVGSRERNIGRLCALLLNGTDGRGRCLIGNNSAHTLSTVCDWLS